MKPRIFTLKAIRKTSHLTKRLAANSANFLGKVENKATYLIENGLLNDSVNIDDFIYHKFPHITPVYPVLPQLGQKPSVTVFAFLHPAGFYGGIATLLFVGAKLANKLGYDLRVVQTTGYSDKVDVVEFLNKSGIEMSHERYSTLNLSKRSVNNYGYLPLHEDDVILTSAWWDSYIASAIPTKNKRVYLIQDFEPIFYNNSDEYVLANSTYYKTDFIPVTNTRILLEYFKQNNYEYIAKNASYFEPAPAPDVEIKTPQESSSGKTLFLYGRPNVDRNLFYSAIAAIDKALEDERLQKYKWTIYSAGSNEVPNLRLKNGLTIVNKGKMSTDDYYIFAQSVDVTVSPMLAPHPNYPTLELASLGSTVVTTKWQTKQDLSFYSKNIFMADPTVDSMAQKIIEAATLTKAQRNNNLQENNINTDWNEALDSTIAEVTQKLSL